MATISSSETFAKRRVIFLSFAKHWISKDIPSYRSQSKRAKIAIHWFGKYLFHLLCGKLRERARWTKSRAVIGYPSVSARSGLSVFFGRNNISPKLKRVHESFLSQNILCDSKKHCCVGLKNEKTKRRHHFSNNWLPFQCSLLNK